MASSVWQSRCSTDTGNWADGMLPSLHRKCSLKYKAITVQGLKHTSFAEPPAAAAAVVAAAALAAAVSVLAQPCASLPVAAAPSAVAPALAGIGTAELAVAFGQKRDLVQGLQGTVESHWTAVHHVTQALRRVGLGTVHLMTRMMESLQPANSTGCLLRLYTCT